ncbi:ABC transporter ATP-binding protein [Amorphus orientalis]|uniref:Branched-chain amino acid transport system ATP-binding protein n=1 Tax=Amorphus orientalis TaxID=649198 RepID=A0AAE3VR68_9HYPH|nr:ABC transporter ATP-binding protein [Amorphus orientalis]MDQ0316832.1 branched-chain amino acid transport system ATP-binding protein [Amorphus orientalis]
MRDASLAVDRLVAGYVKGQPIVREVSFSLAPAEILAVFGPNGAGKSTLVKAIAGVAPVFAGAVHCGGSDLAGRPAHRIARAGIGYVPQVRNVFTEMSVRENLDLAIAMRQSRGPTLAEIYELFPDLEEMGRRRAGALSGGQRQMVAISRALLLGPSVLILDEPSAGLSPRNVDLVFQSLRQLRLHVPILLVEQNVKAALRIADRAMLLSEGTVRLSASAEELLDDPAVMETFLGGGSQ